MPSYEQIIQSHSKTPTPTNVHILLHVDMHTVTHTCRAQQGKWDEFFLPKLAIFIVHTVWCWYVV